MPMAGWNVSTHKYIPEWSCERARSLPYTLNRESHTRRITFRRFVESFPTKMRMSGKTKFQMAMILMIAVLRCIDFEIDYS